MELARRQRADVPQISRIGKLVEREIERFECQDENGRRYTIVAYQEFTAFNPLSGSTRWVAGSKRLELADGSSFVNYIDEQRCKIVATDTVVQRV